MSKRGPKIFWPRIYKKTPIQGRINIPGAQPRPSPIRKFNQKAIGTNTIFVAKRKKDIVSWLA
jgi:hypothetical protein